MWQSCSNRFFLKDGVSYTLLQKLALAHPKVRSLDGVNTTSVFSPLVGWSTGLPQTRWREHFGHTQYQPGPLEHTRWGNPPARAAAAKRATGAGCSVAVLQLSNFLKECMKLVCGQRSLRLIKLQTALQQWGTSLAHQRTRLTMASSSSSCLGRAWWAGVLCWLGCPLSVQHCMHGPMVHLLSPARTPQSLPTSSAQHVGALLTVHRHCAVWEVLPRAVARAESRGQGHGAACAHERAREARAYDSSWGGHQQRDEPPQRRAGVKGGRGNGWMGGWLGGYACTRDGVRVLAWWGQWVQEGGNQACHETFELRQIHRKRLGNYLCSSAGQCCPPPGINTRGQIFHRSFLSSLTFQGGPLLHGSDQHSSVAPQTNALKCCTQTYTYSIKPIEDSPLDDTALSPGKEPVVLIGWVPDPMRRATAALGLRNAWSLSSLVARDHHLGCMLL